MPVARDTQGKDQHGWRVISGGAANNDNVGALMLANIFLLLVYGMYMVVMAGFCFTWEFVSWFWIFTLLFICFVGGRV